MEHDISFKKYIKALKGKLPLVVLLVGGLALLLFGGSLTKQAPASSSADYTAAAEEYRMRLERELATLCAAVDGVGRVSVMIALDGGECCIYAADRTSSGASDYVISSGTGLLLERRMPSVRGVAVVCEGGSNDRVRYELTCLVSSLLALPSSRVYVTGGSP